MVFSAAAASAYHPPPPKGVWEWPTKTTTTTLHTGCTIEREEVEGGGGYLVKGFASGQVYVAVCYNGITFTSCGWGALVWYTWLSAARTGKAGQPKTQQHQDEPCWCQQGCFVTKHNTPWDTLVGIYTKPGHCRETDQRGMIDKQVLAETNARPGPGKEGNKEAIQRLTKGNGLHMCVDDILGTCG